MQGAFWESEQLYPYIICMVRYCHMATYTFLAFQNKIQQIVLLERNQLYFHSCQRRHILTCFFKRVVHLKKTFADNFLTRVIQDVHVFLSSVEKK